MTTIEEFLVRLAERGLQLMDERDGTMPAGCNGPHSDPETPVRNTGHWLCLFAYAHERTGSDELQAAVERALSYLLSREARPVGRTFYHRTNPRKDAANGLIGQVWSIEALVAAHRALGDDRALRIAVEVADMHPFDDALGLWEAVDVSGTIIGHDLTFNHQLWFGVQLLELADESGSVDLREKCEGFLAKLPEHLHTDRDGVIRHAILAPTSPGAAGHLRALLRRLRRLRNREAIRRWEVGYQTFNLYAFARLQRLRPQAVILGSPALRRAVDLVHRDSFSEEVSDSPYGFAYNAPGFEMPVILETFDEGDGAGTGAEDAGLWFERQCELTFDPHGFAFSRNTPDSTTLTARAYELCRFERAQQIAVPTEIREP